MTKLLGGILMAVGILVAGLSGLCSLIFLVSMGSSGDGAIVLLIGGIPFVVGVGLFLLGRMILRSDRKDESPPLSPPPPS